MGIDYIPIKENEPGDRALIFTQTQEGDIIPEGLATILEFLGDDTYAVRFYHSPENICIRYVPPTYVQESID